MSRSLTVVFALALLSGCAAPPPAQVVPENCAVPTDRGETDGGYGGTGHAPVVSEECEAQPQL